LERNKSFDQVVSEYDLMRPQYTENLFQDIIKTAHVKSGSKVLEIGCGTGQATGPFLKTGAYIKALDLGENLLNYSRDKFSAYDTIDFLCADFHTYQVEEDNYDLVISATAFHWIKPEIGYSKVLDALKAGGYAALFWNIPSIEKSNGGLYQTIQDIYAKHAPNLAKKKGGADYSPCLTWYQKTGFQNIQSKTYHSQRKLSGQAYINLLDTYSDHQTLDKTIKDKLYRDIKVAIEKQGNQLIIDDRIEAYIAQKPLDLQTAQSLIVSKYPGFKDSFFKENTKGWANYVICVDDQYIFRFPRNLESFQSLETEKIALAILKEMAETRALAIGFPDFKYQSDSGALHTFVGYQMIEGEELTLTRMDALSESERDNLAQGIGAFLSLLHSPEYLNRLSSEIKLRSLDDQWTDLREQVMTLGQAYFSSEDLKRIELFFKSFFDTYDSGIDPVITHSDFTSDHILIDKSDKLTGIIDFGDLAIGDRAFDFTGLYAEYGRTFTEKVIDAYEGKIDDNFMARIETFYMKQVPLHGFLHGIQTGNQAEIDLSIEAIKTLILN